MKRVKILAHIAAVPNKEGQRCLRCCEQISNVPLFGPGMQVFLTDDGDLIEDGRVILAKDCSRSNSQYRQRQAEVSPVPAGGKE